VRWAFRNGKSTKLPEPTGSKPTADSVGKEIQTIMALAKQNVSKTPPAPQLISLSPDDATQGGLIDDIDCKIIDAQTCEWDYNGNAPAGPALAVQFEDRNGATHDQYYSAGKAEDWSHSEDGTGFIAVSGKTGFNSSSNLMKFFASLVECGFPKELLAAGNVKCLIGTDCHVMQVKQERKGLVRKGKNAEREYSTLLVSKIHSLPGADTKQAGKVAGKPATGTSTKAANGKPNGQAATSNPNEEIDSVLVGALMEALADTDPQPKKALVQIAAKAFADGELKQLRSKAIARANAADFLKGLPENGISFDGAQFSMA